ncbi:hypothetical protein [Candidatus Enterovibrio escicola]|nr:hypothetical protein [Candidatus Enterovibrio escacola]
MTPPQWDITGLFKRSITRGDSGSHGFGYSRGFWVKEQHCLLMPALH